MENYNHVSLQGGGQDSEANADDEGGDDAVKKDDSNGTIDPQAKLPGTLLFDWLSIMLLFDWLNVVLLFDWFNIVLLFDWLSIVFLDRPSCQLV